MRGNVRTIVRPVLAGLGRIFIPPPRYHRLLRQQMPRLLAQCGVKPQVFAHRRINRQLHRAMVRLRQRLAFLVRQRIISGGEYCGGRPVVQALPGRIVVRLNCGGEPRRPDLLQVRPAQQKPLPPAILVAAAHATAILPQRPHRRGMAALGTTTAASTRRTPRQIPPPRHRQRHPLYPAYQIRYAGAAIIDRQSVKTAAKEGRVATTPAKKR